MPKVRKKANSQSRSSLVANVITKLYATSDPRFSTGFKMSTNVGAGCGCHPTSEQSSLFSSSLSTCLARPVGGFSGLSRVHYVWEERNGGTEANADLFLRCRTLLNAGAAKDVAGRVVTLVTSVFENLFSGPPHGECPTPRCAKERWIFD